jgi:hypothetical protein
MVAFKEPAMTPNFALEKASEYLSAASTESDADLRTALAELGGEWVSLANELTFQSPTYGKPPVQLRGFKRSMRGVPA